MQLENTLKDLTKEIEVLSIQNARLLEDLKTHSFFEKYNNAISDYNEVLKEINVLKAEQEALINFRIKNVDTFNMRQRVYTSMSIASNKYNEFLGNIPITESDQRKTGISETDTKNSLSRTCRITSVKVPEKGITLKVPKNIYHNNASTDSITFDGKCIT